MKSRSYSEGEGARFIIPGNHVIIAHVYVGKLLKEEAHFDGYIGQVLKHMLTTAIQQAVGNDTLENVKTTLRKVLRRWSIKAAHLFII